MSHFPLPYIGSKRRDIEFFENYFPAPTKYNIIMEPFAGSAAVSYHLRDNVNQILLADSNPLTCQVYKKWMEGYQQLARFTRTKAGKAFISSNAGRFAKVISANTDKKEEFRQTLLKKGKFMCGDWKGILQYANAKTFIFLDPPYFDSANISYYSVGTDDESRVVDNTQIFIDILDLLKKSKSYVMLIINKNAITEYLYKDYIVGEYDKIYGLTGRIATHLIITNY